MVSVDYYYALKPLSFTFPLLQKRGKNDGSGGISSRVESLLPMPIWLSSAHSSFSESFAATGIGSGNASTRNDSTMGSLLLSRLRRQGGLGIYLSGISLSFVLSLQTRLELLNLDIWRI
jgi:hypothetical protein